MTVFDCSQYLGQGHGIVAKRLLKCQSFSDKEKVNLQILFETTLHNYPFEH